MKVMHTLHDTSVPGGKVEVRIETSKHFACIVYKHRRKNSGEIRDCEVHMELRDGILWGRVFKDNTGAGAHAIVQLCEVAK
jgi:transcription initiation factor TFIID subunit TAF12